MATISAARTSRACAARTRPAPARGSRDDAADRGTQTPPESASCAYPPPDHHAHDSANALLLFPPMIAPSGGTQRPQVRRPRVAQVVASALRDQILSGALRDGGALPKQEELLAEFN